MSLASLGYGPFYSAQIDLLNRPDLVPARVRSASQNRLHLWGCRATLGELSGKLRHRLRPHERPVAGDWVAVADAGDEAVVQHVLDRRTALLRRAPGSAGERQVIAANVEVFFIVTCADRDFNERRLERYLTAVWDAGAQPVIVVNKVDLGADLVPLVEAIDRIGLGVPMARVSARTGEGMTQLCRWIEHGTTAALIGSSGVGKSSLANFLLAAPAQATAALRNDGRGRHTTTRRELVLLPRGGLLLDTPGMRELGMVDDDGGFDASFADILALASSCRFNDCRHLDEPGCAVLVAVAAGELGRERLANYHKLRAELAAAERRRDPTQAGRSKRRWKSIHKSMRARKKIDPKLAR